MLSGASLIPDEIINMHKKRRVPAEGIRPFLFGIYASSTIYIVDILHHIACALFFSEIFVGFAMQNPHYFLYTNSQKCDILYML